MSILNNQLNKTEAKEDLEPFDLLEGWEWTTIGTIAALNPPKPSRNALSPNALVTFVPMPAVDAKSGSIIAPENRPFSVLRKGFTSFRDKDVIFAKITPCMENGKVAIARNLTNGLGFGSTEFHVLRLRGAVIPEYLFYYIRQEIFRRKAEEEMTGSVGQRRVPAEFLKNAPLPLPPLAEQNRIVGKIEELLTQVNLVRERLAKVQGILKRFRQAVLAAACSGRLTTDWREANPNVETAEVLATNGHHESKMRYVAACKLAKEQGIKKPTEPPSVTSPLKSLVGLEEIPKNWGWYSAVTFYQDARYGTSSKCYGFYDRGIPVLRIPNIVTGQIELTNLKYADFAKKDLEKLCLQPGDIIICRTNGSLDLIGKAAIIPYLTSSHVFASYLIRIRLEPDSILPEYYHLYLSSRNGRDFIEEKTRSTAGQFNLNLKILGELPIPLPPLKEQYEIVERVNKLLKLATAIEKKVSFGDGCAERFMQAILAKAFRGELVPKEAELARREGRSYEPASVLLSRIKGEGEKKGKFPRLV